MMVFIANIFLFWLLCEAKLSEISQPESLKTLNLGDSAMIKCHIKSKMTKRVWYKLTTERKLQLVATLDSYYNRRMFADEFQHRYSVQFDELNCHLIISRTSWDDVGTYFCGVLLLNDIEFGSGTLLMLKGAKMVSDSVVQLPPSQSVQSGDSLTLSCSVHTECTAEYMNVMWLKNSDHSAPEMIYSENNGSACQKTKSGETTCVYNLLMRNISSDDAGVYYCVVTSCGQMLLGNGTKLIFNYGTDSPDVGRVCILVPTILLGAYLAFVVCMIKSCESSEGYSAHSTIYAEVQENEHLKIKRSKRLRDDTWTECVYSTVKQY
ncbi:signal-regulatory protein beta-2-like [Mugil cephalus]|uniref:signal-regulatory protein beta-2-like n=1 Tax=Mugil cephalus TaxID=48193 RepID=UPI001FB84F0E|nr:signal-regulatory protein beta-2-like [Mugil cephalus]